MIIKLKSDYTYEMILFESLDIEISSIDVHTYSGPESGKSMLAENTASANLGNWETECLAPPAIPFPISLVIL